MAPQQVLVPSFVPWRILIDIRTERTLRYCTVYAASLACFLTWNYTVKTELGPMHVPSTTYWTILLVMGSISLVMQYSVGFQCVMFAFMVIAVTLSGLIITPVVPAIQSSLWAGWLIISAMFMIVIGPIFAAVEPTILHIFGMLVSIVVEFIYTPSLSIRSSPLSELYSVPNLWQYGIQSIMINLGMWIAISLVTLAIPPWRSARVQLHDEASKVIHFLADGFDIAAAGLSDPVTDLQAALALLPKLEPGLLYQGIAPSKDSIEEISIAALFEPSLKHPGTLSALPTAWADFSRAAGEVYVQTEMLIYAAASDSLSSSSSGPYIDPEVAAVAIRSAAEVLRALAVYFGQEPRGGGGTSSWRSSFLPSCLGGLGGEGAARQAQEDLAAARSRTSLLARNLGLLILQTSRGKRGGAGKQERLQEGPPLLALSSFLIITKGLRQQQQPPPQPPQPQLQQPPQQGEGGQGSCPDLAEIVIETATDSPPAPSQFERHGFFNLIQTTQEIERHLRTVALGNLLKQALISGGFMLSLTLFKAWLQCMTVLCKPWGLVGRGKVWRQPVHVYYTAQFSVGVCCLFAATTFWDAYRNWGNTGGHGATWPLMAFLVVLQPTSESTIDKALMRIAATISGVLLAWAVSAISSQTSWLISASTLLMAPIFWLLPDRRSTFPLRHVGDLVYFSISFSFAYTMTLSYAGIYGQEATVVTRLVSQVGGCCIAILVSLLVLPVSGTAEATSAAYEALVEMEEAGIALANKSEGEPGRAASPLLEEAVEHLGRAEAACKVVAVHVASLRAYPLTSKLATNSGGTRLFKQLIREGEEGFRMLKLLKSITKQMQHHFPPGSAEVDPFHEVVRDQLGVIQVILKRRRRVLVSAYKARHPLLAFLSYLPTYFVPSPEEKAAAAAAALAGEAGPMLGMLSFREGGRRVPSLTDQDPPPSTPLPPVLKRLFTVIWQGISQAGSRIDSTEGMERELDRFIKDGSGALSFPLDRMHLGYLLAMAELGGRRAKKTPPFSMTSIKKEEGEADKKPQP